MTTEFNKKLAKETALALVGKAADETGLAEAFAEVCYFLHIHYPQYVSKKRPSDIYSTSDLSKLARQHFGNYRRSDFPKQPCTIPDEVVSINRTAQ